MSDKVSYIKTENGAQVLYVNGAPMEGLAYITYLTDRNCYADFAKAGYRLFSFPVFFGYNILNEETQLPVFTKGIFDDDVPDFSVLDRDIEEILETCPDAYIFPRVNVSLSKRWEAENPDELCYGKCDQHPDSNIRPCFASDKWAREIKREMRLFIEHIEAMPYKEHIIGYQIAGGNTEEWFPYDKKGSVGRRSDEKFEEYKRQTGIVGTTPEYMQFLSDLLAERICEFAAYLKELTRRRFVVGCFYGYILSFPNINSNHHALGTLLNCEDIDFMCSPISYDFARKAGMDHVYMLPVDSVKLHNKLYFSENDTRTNISITVNDMPYYNSPLWFGPPTEEQTLEILKMHFARPLLNGHACWWFDMWGGWYNSVGFMEFMEKCMDIYREAMTLPLQSCAEAAVFVDEKAYCIANDYMLSRAVCSNLRHTLGRVGTPYNIYLAQDYPLVDLSRYKAVILCEPAETVASRVIKAHCAQSNIPLLTINKDNADITASCIRGFYRESGMHIYSENNLVLYANESFIFVHTTQDGEHRIYLPEDETLVDVFTDKPFAPVFTAPAGRSFILRRYKK